MFKINNKTIMKKLVFLFVAMFAMQFMTSCHGNKVEYPAEVEDTVAGDTVCACDSGETNK